MTKDWISIKAMDLSHNPMGEYPTVADASKMFSISKRQVYNCCEANRKSDQVTYESINGIIFIYEHEK